MQTWFEWDSRAYTLGFSWALCAICNARRLFYGGNVAVVWMEINVHGMVFSIPDQRLKFCIGFLAWVTRAHFFFFFFWLEICSVHRVMGEFRLTSKCLASGPSHHWVSVG